LNKPLADIIINNRLIPEGTLKGLYVTMRRIRRLEEKIADILTVSKEIKCPVQLYIGQEAVAAGVCAVLKKDDYVFSNHRSHGHYLAKGGDMKGLVAEVFTRAAGCSGGRGGSMHLISPENGLLGSPAIVAGTIPLAVGTALASALRKEPKVSVVFFGDGAVDEGAFHESLNFASLKNLPVIFVCENNLYSTHMPIASCLADPEIYKKAKAYGMPGVRVDGNDVTAVLRAAKKAASRARGGQGPTLMECMTYRWRGHVGPSDDIDKGLRSRAELDAWIKRDPLKALGDYLLKKNITTAKTKSRLDADINQEIDDAIAFARQSPPPDPSTLLENVFKDGTG
jgi:acetoin:2,6-dichlorophenolindophenol oxidoreductase subunit alpha